MSSNGLPPKSLTRLSPVVRSASPPAPPRVESRADEIDARLKSRLQNTEQRLSGSDSMLGGFVAGVAVSQLLD